MWDCRVPCTGIYEDVLWLIHRSESSVVIVKAARTPHLWRRCVSASVLIRTHHTREAIKLNDKIMFGIEWTYVFLSTSYSNCVFEKVPAAAAVHCVENIRDLHTSMTALCVFYGFLYMTCVCGVLCEILRTESFNLTKHNVRARHGYEQWTVPIPFFECLFFSLSVDETWVRLSLLLCMDLWKLMINFGACKWRRYKTST